MLLLPDNALRALRECRDTAIICARAIQNASAMPEDTDAARRDKLVDVGVVLEFLERHLCHWIAVVDLIDRIHHRENPPCETSSKT